MKRQDLNISVVRIYRLKWSVRAAGLIFPVASMLALCVLIAAAISGEKELDVWTISISLLFMGIGIFLTAYMFTSAITLFEDAIELQTLLYRRRLPFAAIRGRRICVTETRTRISFYVRKKRSLYRLKLESKDSRFPSLDFDKRYNFDWKFYKWFSRLPDLDTIPK
jgi:hypothetical protein